MTRLIYLLVTCCGAGRVPFAPGTLGSAIGLALGLLLLYSGGLIALAGAAILTNAIGFWAVARYLRKDTQQADAAGHHDPSEVIIDEIAGQFIAMLPCAWLVPHGAGYVLAGAFASFVLFRIFDIIKPGPIGSVDRMQSSLAVMLDDLLAGIAAAILLSLAILAL